MNPELIHCLYAKSTLINQNVQFWKYPDEKSNKPYSLEFSIQRSNYLFGQK